jgi:hypothetical protein
MSRRRRANREAASRSRSFSGEVSTRKAHVVACICGESKKGVAAAVEIFGPRPRHRTSQLSPVSQTGDAHAVGVVARDGDLQTNDERFVEELAQMQAAEADAVKSSTQLQAELDAACAAVRGQLPPTSDPEGLLYSLPSPARAVCQWVQCGGKCARTGATVYSWALAVNWCGGAVQADGVI